VNQRVLAVVAATSAIAMLFAGTASARNPHCAGGIQYLTQALADYEKHNDEDYRREITKAVQQLEQCASEDPVDFEAIGYLGWAYGKVDSMCAAGKAFRTAIDGLAAKGDKKKLEQVTNNRDSFWATSFNKGIASINTAQGLWNPYPKAAESDEDKTAKADAKKNYDEAIVSLDHALCLKPGDPRSLRNLGAVYAFMGEYQKAEEYFKQGLESAPGDSDLTAAIKSARTSRAGQLIDEKKYDEAIAYYQTLLREDTRNGDLWSGLGDAAFSKARTADSASKKPTYCLAADAYAKAGALRPSALELPYNAAICYQNCGNLAAAEEQWRAALKVKSDDCEVLVNLSSVLADEKKFPDAIGTAMKAIVCDPKDKAGYRQMGAIYNKAGDNPHSKQFLYAYLALDKGKPAENPTDASGADGAKLKNQMGKPDAIYPWEADGQKFETWFYWSKGQAFHFGGGAQQEKTDWSAAIAPK
jgi:tetratricopeptide (TPR) repeat protein